MCHKRQKFTKTLLVNIIKKTQLLNCSNNSFYITHYCRPKTKPHYINNNIRFNSLTSIVQYSTIEVSDPICIKNKSKFGCHRNIMKRTCLIESVEGFQKKNRNDIDCNTVKKRSTMFKNTIWYRDLLGAKKSCIQDNKLKKIHYNFEDGKEMVEEYNVDTQVLLRRAWKVKGKLGGEGKWDVEIGDPIPNATPRIDSGADIMESKDQPLLSRRNTRINLEWRIRNLPYPIETYSTSANNDERCIIVRTTNKKYFKRLQVPELDRLSLPIEQANISSTHQFQTLIIMYKKPQLMLEMEKEWFQELTHVKPVKDIPNECKTQ